MIQVRVFQTQRHRIGDKDTLMSILFSGYTQQCANQIHSNQDKYGGLRVFDSNKKEISIVAVADGISLGYEGKYASYNTVLWLLQWAAQYFPSNTFDIQKVAREIQMQMVQYNHRLNDFSDLHSSKDTCCTICGMVTDGEQILIFNAGDSRLYELNPSGQVRCLTQDDRAEDGYSIAMHIGGKTDAEIRITFSTDAFHPDSRYMICSDGFYKQCNLSGFCPAILNCTNRAEIISTIEAYANGLVEAGETDDITALVLARSG